MMFMELDHGAILRRETGLDTPKIVRFVIGNPLIMKETAKHVPDRSLLSRCTSNCVSASTRGTSAFLSYLVAPCLPPTREILRNSPPFPDSSNNILE